MKVFKIIMVVFFCGFSFFMIFIMITNFSGKKYKDDKDLYFSKSSLYFEGQVYDYKYLGGVTSLLYIKVDSIKFHYNKLDKNDDFTGIYDSKNGIAIVIAIFDYPDIRDKVINSIDKKLFYKSLKFNDSSSLRPSGIYRNYLIKEEKKNKNKNFKRF
ncbi:hypothetical protein HNQ02_002927 [Flavobacterium sp. 7E]|uniref:hypothetical protein n=1 Tax=Flavobacterium sp. 7E TaxID=2735898 RepID=UPI00156F90F5|nr:hypothetical protein [Flavobacterium sp. 7E]NRS89992.1 hypothetical protein [Flavobacterium sp. 7E]